MKSKFLIAIIPIVVILFVIIIILSIIVTLFGSENAIYQSYFVLPFDCNTYTITSPYGNRENPINSGNETHKGIDIVPTSSNIVAIANGTVVVSEMQNSGGETVVIEHHISGQVYRSWYHHLKEDSRVVNVGDTVKQGQQIGIMGATGQVTGIHLHFALQKFNASTQRFEYIDPSTVIQNNIQAKEFYLFDYENKSNDEVNKISNSDT